MSLKTEIAGNNIIFTAGNLIAAVIAFVTSILLARYLGPEGFGLYSMVLVVSGIFIVFTDFPTGSAITRFSSFFLGKKQIGKIKMLIKYLLKLRIISTVSIGMILILLPSQISIYIFNKPGIDFVILASGILILTNSFIEFSIGFFNGVGAFRKIVTIRIVEKINKFVFPIAFVLIGMGYLGAIFGILVASLMALLLVVGIWLKKYIFIFRTKVSTIDKKMIWEFGLWSFISAVAITLFSMVDSFMISVLGTVPEVGFYRIAVTWTYTITTLIPLSGFVMYSYFSRKQKKQYLSNIFSSSLFYTSMMVFPLSFLLSAFAGPIIEIFYGQSYIQSANVLTILGLSAIPLVIGAVIIAYFSGINRPDITTKIVSFSLIINAVLNYVLIINMGIIGAAIATLIALIVEIVIMFVVVAKITGVTCKFAYLYKPLLASCIMYYITTFFVASNLLELIVYGIISALIYIGIMLLIRGMGMKDIQDILRLFRSGLR